MKIRQHVPNFVDIPPAPEEEFNSPEELLAIPWVVNFKGLRGDKFDKFVKSKHRDSYLLMATYENGKHWWVVGYLDGEPNFLPEWDGGTK